MWPKTTDISDFGRIAAARSEPWGLSRSESPRGFPVQPPYQTGEIRPTSSWMI